MDQERHEVRLYSNRRLYDTVQRRYIKFEDLHDLLLNGIQFTVRDQQSDQDCTHRVLIDLLVRREFQLVAPDPEILTTAFLELFIRLSNSEASPLVAKFLDHTAQTLLSDPNAKDRSTAAAGEKSYADESSELYATDP